MTEFEYDCYQKKNVAHSAMKRKCGSKSKKCKLPSDGISQKQWSERCGEIVSYQIGRPMTWRDFGKLPKDLKEEYLNNLIEKYSVNARNLADMFGISVATIFRLVKNEGLNVKFQKGRHPTAFEAEQFQIFLSGGQDCIEQEPLQQEEKIDSVDVSLVEENTCGNTVQKEHNGTHLDSFTMSFSGPIDVNMIANSLRYILGPERNAKILISCEIDPT